MDNYRPVSAMILSDSFSDGEKFLIVKKPRKNHAWQFPQGGVDGEESYLEAAERELKEECGENLQIIFLYSWPVGEYHYDFPDYFVRFKGKYSGARVQFFRGILESGEVKIDNEEIVDYKWVGQEEFANYFAEDYLEGIEGFIEDLSQ